MHEIRNPLEALGNLVYLTLQEANQPETVRKYMELAEEQIATLNRISAQVLSFARLSQSLKPVDPIDLTEAALRIHQRAIQAKQIHLVKRLARGLTAELRNGQMLQVISNLIANAVEAMPEGGTLSLRLRRRHNRLSLLVADNGHGMQPEHVKRLFEPFFTTKGESGNGLGLALCRRIVQEHGGTIRVRTSVRPGRAGTAFRVMIPCSQAEAAPA